MACCIKACSKENDENQVRGNWSSKREYVLSAVGLAVGLENFWRFPAMCYRNGGGAFLIPYVVMLLTIGIPMFMLETSMAQFSSSTVLKLYEVCPAMRGIGYTSLVATGLATVYFSVLSCYPLVFIWYSFTYNFETSSFDPLPWVHCNHSWNTESCSENVMANLNYTNYEYVANFSSQTKSPSEEFFVNGVLSLSSGVFDLGRSVPSINVANFIVWIIIFLIIIKGVKVIGKVMQVTAVLPFVLLLVLLVRSMTLPGAWPGIKYYILPNYTSLLSVHVWKEAAIQLFYSLGIGWGSLQYMGSYNRFHNNTLTDAMIVPIVNLITSFVAGLVVFSALGFLADQTGQGIYEIGFSGMDLAFITYPAVIAMMPGSHFWSLLFFIMVFLLGIDTCFIQVQTIVTALVDHFPTLRTKETIVAAAVCGVSYFCSLLVCTEAGMFWTILLDSTVSAQCVLLIGIAEILVFSYIYGCGRLLRDVELVMKRSIGYYFWINWLVLTPLLLLIIYAGESYYRQFDRFNIRYGDYTFPQSAQYLSYATSCLILNIAPLYWCFYMFTEKGWFNERLSRGHNPSESWGPALASHRNAWLEHCKNYTSKWTVRKYWSSDHPAKEYQLYPLVPSATD